MTEYPAGAIRVEFHGEMHRPDDPLQVYDAATGEPATSHFADLIAQRINNDPERLAEVQAATLFSPEGGLLFWPKDSQ